MENLDDTNKRVPIEVGVNAETFFSTTGGRFTFQNQASDINVLNALIPWQDYLADFGNKPLGTTKVYLQQKECASGECNLGNFYTDAMLNAFLHDDSFNQTNWSNVSIAITTQGNFRVPINKGVITYNHLITMCPWQNKLYALNLKGKILLDLLEDSVATMKPTQNIPSSSRFLQVSGLHVIYNISKPIRKRIVDFKVRCANCLIPKYVELELDEDYRVVVMEYLANGKNGFSLISNNAKDIIEGPEDLIAFITHMQQNEPIVAGIEGRITILK